MTNNLVQVKKDLKSFAKKCKNFKYTDSALLTFLLNGMLITFGTENLFAESVTKSDINNQVSSINTSIGNLRTDFKRARAENNKLIRDTNLELTQLMEQGDHVVKSPWSSWQYGANTILNDWKGSYKGRGDKAEKYPYEGILKRDSNAYNRYISKESSMYQYLPQSSDPMSASTNSRNGYSSYGLASNKTVSEPPVSFEISASIKPRIVTKGAITVPAPAALEPTLPKAIDFNPVEPGISKFIAPVISLDNLTMPGTANGDNQYIYTGSAYIGTNSYSGVAPIAQQSMSGGQMTATVGSSGPDVSASGITFIGHAGGVSTPNGSPTLAITNYKGTRTPAIMKEIGGNKLDIQGVTFNYSGNNPDHNSGWLFHTDAHSSSGESSWNLDSGTKINANGENLVVYYSQYHGDTATTTSSTNANVGFINNGQITTSGNGSNYIWIAAIEHGTNGRNPAWIDSNRLMYFVNGNTGKITLSGAKDIFARMFTGSTNTSVSPSQLATPGGGFYIENNGELTLAGNNQVGITFTDNQKYNDSEIILTKPIEIKGDKSSGIYFNGFVNLDGGTNRIGHIAPNSVRSDLTGARKASILNIDITGGSQNAGLYFKYNGTDEFKPMNYTLNSKNSDGNALVYVGDGVVNLGATTKTDPNAPDIYITGGKGNVGIYNNSSKTGTGGFTVQTAAKIKAENTESASGIISTAGILNNTGKIDIKGKAVKGIVSRDGATVTSTGPLVLEGTAESATNGSVGLVALNGGKLTQNGVGTSIKVDGSASTAAYADGKYQAGSVASGTKLDISNAALETTGGAFNVFAKNNAEIDLSNVTIDTGQKSLAFSVDNTTGDSSKINFTGQTIATIRGGNDSNSRGTAFLYKGTNPTGYTNFITQISSWAGSKFGNMNNLTLNMEDGSRLFIAQGVQMNLSNTTVSGLETSLGMTPGHLIGNSSKYKTFMLYLSKLDLDDNIDLDNSADKYNMLEIANSSITNNNTQTISGTKSGQVAIAQKNDGDGAYLNDRSKVTLENNGVISLTGDASTGIYAKFGELKNTATGIINMGDSSSAMYGTDDSLLENLGTINLGNNSTGLYSEGDTATGKTAANTKGSVRNDGTIASAGKAIGITYKGTGAGNTDTRVTNDTNGKINLAGEGSVGIYGLGNSYKILNNGEINLGSSSSLTSNPNVGIYTPVESVKVENSATGKITAGNNSIGIYGFDIDNAGQITTGDNGIGIYSKKLSTGPSTVNHTGTITVGNNDATGIFLEDGGTLNFNSGSINVGDNSYGIVAIGSSPFNYNNTSTATVTLGNGSTYFYSNNPTTNFTNNIALNNPSGVGIYGISSPGTIVNNANFTLGDQSVGILNTGNGVATNNATIVVGNSDTGSKNYAIGMATTTGKVVNSGSGSITVGADGIGLFADGANAQAENAGTINIAGDHGMGIYLDHGAKGVNNGTITTVGTPTGAVGVVVQHKAELTNNGTININSPEGYAMFKATGGVIKNYGTITLGSGATETFDPTSKPTSKTAGGISINAPTGATPATTTVTTIDHGTISSIVSPEHVVINNPQGPAGPSPTSLGIYIDTLGSTNPISGNLGLITDEADLIIGTEAARTTNSKNIVVSGAVLDPYVQMMDANSGVTWNAYGGSLTWIATPLYSNGQLGSVVLAKLPYTEFAGNETTPVNSTDTYNFLHGLDDRYGVDWYGDRGAREKQLFNKLNDIGKNEEALFYQATDEMMGHQYGNVQQRINETGSLLDKEFRYLNDQWRNPSKQNNKIKVFGMRNEYNTDTAGIIDYTSNAYGVAYVHEDETVKLGNSSGWYAGAVNNRFKFKDIGKSRENQTMVKAGIFKTMSPYMDHNGSLRWTIAGDVFLGKNEMKRKFLVVDDIFNAKGDYTSYGAAFKTDLGYDIRMSERTHLRPYGALKMEYGRFNSIKEDSGEIRLEVDGNDYFSVKPEAGIEFKYVQPMAVRTQLSVGLSAAYENELGRVADGKNKARVRFTDADWFGIRGEKEDRRGSGKFDLNIGVDNTRFGVTANLGYDTKGSNIRGGIGFRAIY